MGIQIRQCPSCGQRYYSGRPHRCAQGAASTQRWAPIAKGAAAIGALVFLGLIGWTAYFFAHGDRRPKTGWSESRELHPWWKLSSIDIDRYFEEGQRARQRGAELLDCGFEAKPARTLERETTVDGAALFAPPFALKTTGWVAEDERWSADECHKVKGEIHEETSAAIIAHVGVLSRSGQVADIKGFSFNLETHRGETVRALTSATTDLTGGGSLAKPWYRVEYIVSFPLKSDDNQPHVSQGSKWVTLWVNGHENRMACRFWLDGAMKSEAGMPVPKMNESQDG